VKFKRQSNETFISLAANTFNSIPAGIYRLCRIVRKKPQRNRLLVVGHALIDLATAAQIVATSFVPGLYQTMCGQ
jgi:hypothetical protein